mmetsp:Transcript_81293/g.169912  ORF Transcript_81293/g.169912 Transcript_81293/m.169912 type:complete len:257 (+) Transcript_81293:746-1516(+)
MCRCSKHLSRRQRSRNQLRLAPPRPQHLRKRLLQGRRRIGRVLLPRMEGVLARSRPRSAAGGCRLQWPPQNPSPRLHTHLATLSCQKRRLLPLGHPPLHHQPRRPVLTTGLRTLLETAMPPPLHPPRSLAPAPPEVPAPTISTATGTSTQASSTIIATMLRTDSTTTTATAAATTTTAETTPVASRSHLLGQWAGALEYRCISIATLAFRRQFHRRLNCGLQASWKSTSEATARYGLGVSAQLGTHQAQNPAGARA